MLLRPEQAERLVAAVSGAHPECPVGFCYAPQHAFVFYDAAKRPVARVEVCFHCFAHQAQPMIANGRVPADWLALFELCADLRLPLTPGEEFKRLYTERLTRRSSERALRAALLRKPCPTAAVPVAEFISVNITRLSSIRRPPPRRFLHPAPLRVPCSRGGKGAWKGLLGAKKCGFWMPGVTTYETQPGMVIDLQESNEVLEKRCWCLNYEGKRATLLS